MKKGFFVILTVVGLLVCLWLLKQKQSTTAEVRTQAQSVSPSEDHASQNISQYSSEQSPMISNTVDVSEEWVKNRSAGLVIPQRPDPNADDYNGQDIIQYRYQIRTSERPIMLGEGHERRNYRIYVNSPSVNPYPLSVTYPRWWGAGIENSGGFVFLRDENPITKIGVIVPKVKLPGDALPGEEDLLEWQVLIRVNDRFYVDAKTAAISQSMGSEVVVLMPTHPDKIPVSSSVVWFNFEKDGTVTLLED